MANPRTIARLSARIHERAAYCLQFEINDPRASFITVTRVELTPDVTAGKIFYSVLGSEADKNKAQHMLDSAAGFIQRQVARVLDLRRMPHLKWVFDDSVQRASDLDAIIREARARDREINPSVDESGAIADAAAVEAPAIDDGDAVDVGDDEEDGDDEETR